jgi:hypothetical protein
VGGKWAIVEWAILQLLSYPLLCWLLFVVIAFLAAHCVGWIGVFVGHLVIALMVSFLNVGYAVEQGYMDIIFTMGVLARNVLVNTVLLPVRALGLLAQVLSMVIALLAFTDLRKREWNSNSGV